MKIGSISEEISLEKRVSFTPNIVKKFVELGIEVFINKNYFLF